MTAQGTSESPPTAPAPGLPPQSPPERCPSPPLDDATTISPEALRHLLQPADENEVEVCLEEILLCVGMNELCDGDASRFRSDEWSQAVPKPHGFDPTDKSTWHGSIWTPKRAASIEAAENLIYKGYPPSLILRVSFPEFENYPGFGDSLAYSIIADIDMREERRRLEQYQSFEDAVRLFKNSQRVLVLTGAGVSVSCGIPDFRSRDGIYSRLKVIYPELKDPSLMFDIHYFQLNPATFYNFAKDIFPGQFEPSLSHKFIRQLEKNGRLLRNYTQNIDTLERQAGIQRVVECHGSFSRVTCRDCKASFDGDVIKEDVMAQRVAKCPQCVEGILKPDIVFFGEDLSPYFHLQMAIDKEKPDLIVIIGSSLKVRPVALIPQAVPHQVPHIFINREKLAHYHPDIELLGDCDEIIRNICLALGGSYSTLLDEHEESMNARRAPDAPTYSLSRELRTFIDQESLKPVLDAVGIRSDSPPSLNGEPKAGSSAADGDDEATNDSDAPTKKRRRLDTEAREKSLYTHLHTLLPPNTYTIVNDNMSIFPGAEIYYDRETQSLCRPRGGNIADRDDSAEILEDLIDEEPDSSDLEEVEAEDEEEEGEEEGYQNGFLDFNSLPDNPEEDELDDPDDLGEP